MRTRCMTLFAAVAATAFLLLLSAAPAVADETDRSQEVASFYCVTTSPVSTTVTPYSEIESPRR